MTTYRVVRFYADERPSKVLVSGVSLEEAQAHCQTAEKVGGDWTDEYYAEDGD